VEVLHADFSHGRQGASPSFLIERNVIIEHDFDGLSFTFTATVEDEKDEEEADNDSTEDEDDHKRVGRSGGDRSSGRRRPRHGRGLDLLNSLEIESAGANLILIYGNIKEILEGSIEWTVGGVKRDVQSIVEGIRLRPVFS